MLVINFSALGEIEMEKRYIKLEIVATNVATVFFKVKNNKRGFDFNDGQDYFNASNQIDIISARYPAWNGKNVLCVLGGEPKLDDMILNATSVEFERIQQAVKEYNNSFLLA